MKNSIRPLSAGMGVALLMSLAVSAHAQVTATWTGAGGNPPNSDPSYSNPFNWNINGVPVNNATTSYNVFIPVGVSINYDWDDLASIQDLNLAAGSVFTMDPGSSLLIRDDGRISGRVVVNNATFLNQTPGAIFQGTSSRLNVSGGGELRFAATAHDGSTVAVNNTLFSASGLNSLLELSSLQSISDAFNDGTGNVNWHSISANNSGFIDLGALQNVTAPARAEDELRFEVSNSGDIDLTMLQSITGSGRVHLNANPGTELLLPNLQTATSAILDVGIGATMSLPSLLSLSNPTINLSPGSRLDLNLVSQLTNFAINLPGAQFNTPSLTNINNTSVGLSEGAHWGTEFGDLSAQNYVATSRNYSWGMFSATGDGTVLDLSSIQSLNSAWDDGWNGTQVHYITASNNGMIDLSGLQSITVPNRGEDRVDITVSTGGNIDLSSLTTVGGGGNLHFDVNDGLTLNLPSLATVQSSNGVWFDLEQNTTVNVPALLSVNAMSLSIPNGSTINAPLLNTLTMSSLSLSPGANFNTPSMTNINNTSVGLSEGAQWGTGFGDLSAQNYVATSRNYSWGMFSATGAGTVLDLSSIQALNCAWDDGWNGTQVHYITASNDGVINLSGLQSITVPNRGEDRVDITVSTGGSVDLSSLTTVGGGGHLRFDINDGLTLDLPSLASVQNSSGTWFDLASDTTVNLPALQSASGMTLSIPTGSVVNAPALTSLNGAALSFSPGSTLEAPNLQTLTGSSLSLVPGATLNTPSLTNINNTSVGLSEGAQWGTGFGDLSAQNYVATSRNYSWGMFSATGAGTVLDLSSIQSLNSAWDDGWNGTQVHYITASNNGLIDLSGLQTITVPNRGEDRVDITISTGGNIDLSSLTTVGGGGNLHFDVNDGLTLNLPSLATVQSSNGVWFDLDQNTTVNVPALLSVNAMSLSIPNGSTINAPVLNTLTMSSLSLSPGANFNTPVLTNINNTSVGLSEGAQWGSGFGDLSAQNYVATSRNYNWSMFTASGAGTVLDLSSIQALNSAWDDGWNGTQVHYITASNNGVINLSGLQTITVPNRGEDRVDITSSTEAEILLGNLGSVAGGGQLRVIAREGGRITASSLLGTASMSVIVQDILSSFSVEESLIVNAGSIQIAGGSTLSIGGDLIHSLTNEANFQCSAAVVHFKGTATQRMELAGLDMGIVDPENNGNFGIGQLVVGTTEQATVLELLEVNNNGNRTPGHPEALYLFGLGGPDGLIRLNGSTLITHGLKVYIRQPGPGNVWEELTEGFAGGNGFAYGGGMILQERPGDCNCDKVLDADDITAFIQALIDPASYATEHSACAALGLADVDQNGTPNGLDVMALVASLASGG